jgi:NAD(P)-dependent dehydrogenase (short-subunit alcohol dehydrogenase family)
MKGTVMTWTTDNIPDQTGRLAIVTGANGGLGLETARQLARHGAHVVMAARNMEKAEAAKRDLVAEHPDASVEVRSLDLASLDSIRQFAAGVVADHDTVDVLVNNAGVMATPQQKTADGFELQFGTNHLGHFALTGLLLPALLRADAARVVTVTSTSRHFGGRLNVNDPHFESGYNPWRSYGQSKMANLHFAVELNNRLQAAGARVESLVAHPGFSNTDLQAQSARSTNGGVSQRFFHIMVQRVGMSHLGGALPQLRAATDPTATGGELYAPRWVNFGPPARRPIFARSRKPEAMQTLWELSERETGMTVEVETLAGEAR